jgi:hypothetical protein
MEDATMSDRAIEAALEAVRGRIAQAVRQREELDRRLAADREEEKLLVRLLALRRGEGAASVEGEHEPAVTAVDPTTSETGHPAVNAVVEQLVAVGRPLHISELMRLLNGKKVPIPGAGTQANLITHLRRDARLVRPSRGMYGLAQWGLEAMPATQRRVRRRRIRVRARDARKDS